MLQVGQVGRGVVGGGASRSEFLPVLLLQLLQLRLQLPHARVVLRRAGGRLGGGPAQRGHLLLLVLQLFFEGGHDGRQLATFRRRVLPQPRHLGPLLLELVMDLVELPAELFHQRVVHRGVFCGGHAFVVLPFPAEAQKPLHRCKQRLSMRLLFVFLA